MIKAGYDPKLKVGVIVSSEDLIGKINRLAKSRWDQVHTRLICGLDEAVPVGREMEASGCDVVISRRGTAEILREKLTIPVLALMANPLDILISIRKAVIFGKRILITSFRKQMTGMDILEEIYQVRIFQGIYHDSPSLNQVIGKAREKGVEVIIGGGVSMKFADTYGLKGVELYISEEAVAFAVEDALALARLRRQEQEKSRRYQCIIDSSSDAILSVNREGVLTTMNRAARDLLRIRDCQEESHRLIDYLPESDFRRIFQTKQPLLNKLEKVSNLLYLTNHFPINVNEEVAGVVSIMKNTANVIKDENEVRRNFAKGLVARFTIDDLIHKSTGMAEAVRKAKRYALSDSTVLITGETGTGKEVLAQGIHNLSDRSRGPFVSLNCAALPEQLLENELFGHEEGAFTGSRKGGKIGLFELAHTGTIFLDEIASTPPGVQATLLRVLEEKKVMRIGSDRLIPIDVRVLAASNRDLAAEVRAGRFRDDLFFRLNVLSIRLAPLRERMEELPVIVAHCVNKIAARYRIPPLSLPEDCLRRLMSYVWPGNVRQVENFLERLILAADSFTPGVFDELFEEICQVTLPEPARETSGKKHQLERQAPPEGKNLEEILLEARFCKTKAAALLGISRTTLWRKLKKHR